MEKSKDELLAGISKLSGLDPFPDEIFYQIFEIEDNVERTQYVEALRKEVGKEHLVLDLSCRPKEGKYYIVTNRWQKFTDQPLDEALMYELSRYCDEYLVHGVAVEGTGTGIDCELVQILSRCNKLPVTYAGGIGSFSDLEKLDSISGGKMDFTIGSALDLFGGKMKFDEVLKHYS